MEHSKIGASSTHRYIPCPGSVRKCKDIIDVSSEAAEEGSAAHFVGEHALKKGLRKVVGAPAPVSAHDKEEIKRFKKYFCEEMYEHINGYLNLVYEEAGVDLLTIIQVEQKVDLSWLHPGMFGTADTILSNSNKTTVIDLKYGQGIQVEVKDNPACMFYGLGALTQLFGLGAEDGKRIPEDHETEIIIYQPRGFHRDGPIRRWSINSLELVKWGVNVLKPAAEKATSEHAPRVAGPWCEKTFCPALGAGTCDESWQETLELAKSDFSSEVVPSPNLTPAQMARILEVGPAVVKYVEAVKKMAKEFVINGGEVPGKKVVKAFGNRAWKADAAATLGLTYGDSNIYATPPKPKLKSPAQMEKIVPYSELKGLWEKPEKGLALVDEDDSREAFNPAADAARDFDKV